MSTNNVIAFVQTRKITLLQSCTLSQAICSTRLHPDASLLKETTTKGAPRQNLFIHTLAMYTLLACFVLFSFFLHIFSHLPPFHSHTRTLSRFCTLLPIPTHFIKSSSVFRFTRSSHIRLLHLHSLTRSMDIILAFHKYFHLCPYFNALYGQVLNLLHT